MCMLVREAARSAVVIVQSVTTVLCLVASLRWSLSANDLLHDEFVNRIYIRTWSILPQGWILKPTIPRMVRGSKYPSPTIRVTDTEKSLFGLTRMHVRRLAYRYCEANRIPHNFSHTKELAGND